MPRGGGSQHPRAGWVGSELKRAGVFVQLVKEEVDEVDVAGFLGFGGMVF